MVAGEIPGTVCVPWGKVVVMKAGTVAVSTSVDAKTTVVVESVIAVKTIAVPCGD
jgi:hypothetical protein